MTAKPTVLELHALIARIEFAQNILKQVHEAQVKLYGEQQVNLAKQREAAIAALREAAAQGQGEKRT